MAKKSWFNNLFGLRKSRKVGKNANRVSRREKAHVRPVITGSNVEAEAIKEPGRETGGVDRGSRSGGEEIAVEEVTTRTDTNKPEKSKHAQKLNDEQKEQLLEWLTEGYSGKALNKLMQAAGIPVLARSTISEYRTRHGTRIDELRKLRYSNALEEGLAKREERVARLKLHADDLEVMMNAMEGFKGWEHVERAWRATLDQIAEEVGDKDTLGDKVEEIRIKFKGVEA